MLVLQRVQPSSWADRVPAAAPDSEALTQTQTSYEEEGLQAGGWSKSRKGAGGGHLLEKSSQVNRAWLGFRGASVPQLSSPSLPTSSVVELRYSELLYSQCPWSLHLWGEKDFHKGVRGHVSWKGAPAHASGEFEVLNTIRQSPCAFSPFQIFNCSAPDTGNMELLVRYGTRSRRPAGSIAGGKGSPCFAMTEPQVPTLSHPQALRQARPLPSLIGLCHQGPRDPCQLNQNVLSLR